MNISACDRLEAGNAISPLRMSLIRAKFLVRGSVDHCWPGVGRSEKSQREYRRELKVAPGSLRWPKPELCEPKTRRSTVAVPRSGSTRRQELEPQLQVLATECPVSV